MLISSSGWTLRGSIQKFIDVYVSRATFTEVERSFPYMVAREYASGGGDVSEVLVIRLLLTIHLYSRFLSSSGTSSKTRYQSMLRILAFQSHHSKVKSFILRNKKYLRYRCSAAWSFVGCCLSACVHPYASHHHAFYADKETFYAKFRPISISSCATSSASPTITPATRRC